MHLQMLSFDVHPNYSNYLEPYGLANYDVNQINVYYHNIFK